MSGVCGEGDARFQAADHMALVFLVGAVGGVYSAFVQGFVKDFFGVFLGFGRGVCVMITHLTTQRADKLSGGAKRVSELPSDCNPVIWTWNCSERTLVYPKKEEGTDD